MFLSPYQILKELRLPPENVRVGDFGTGAGHYALALAKRLGSQGTIYALDPFGPGLDALRRQAESSPSSFYTLQSDLSHIPLRSNLLNGAVVADTLYGIVDKERFVSELARVLEPGAQVLVVDWAGSFNNMGPSEKEVLTPGEAVKLFASAGFEAGPMIPAGTHHFAFTAACTTP